MNKLFATLCTFTLLPLNSFASSFFEAENHFKSGEYALAKEDYIESTKVGNPQAYFRLATMYLKGLGGEQDITNAILYFSLAAEYDFFNAKEIVSDTLKTLPKESQDALIKAISDFKEENGKRAIEDRFFPAIKEDAVGKRITFDGKDKLESNYYIDDIINSAIATDLFESNQITSDITGDTANSIWASTPAPPYVVLDVDIAADGTIRYHSVAQQHGEFANEAIRSFITIGLKKPSFENKGIDFTTRAYIGSAVFTKFTLLDENEALYYNIVQTVNGLKNSETLEDQYRYAMSLLNFRWLKQEDGEVNQRLLAAAQKGHPGAMYEYGMQLYRKQENIAEAVHWISKAAKYGLARAEYRLAKILRSSPWVENDDAKALYWFRTAYDQGNVRAGLDAIEIKLTSENESLRDVNGAIDWLAELQGRHKRNPDYYYLLSLTYRDPEVRDYPSQIKNLKTAVSRGKDLNWDVSEWEAMLGRLTTGNIFSCELDPDDERCVR